MLHIIFKKTPLRAALVALTMILAAGNCQAHVLVFRFRLASSKSESAAGTKSNSAWPSTLSGLLLLDLDTDYVVEANENADRIWASPSIQLNEKPKSGKNPAAYSFRADDDRNSDSLGKWRHTKSEFYVKNDSKFYFFRHEFDDYGAAGGVDHDSISANGLCNLKVDIGGGRVSSVPKNFVVTERIGENKVFTTKVYNVSYDSTLTRAVNDYLVKENIRSTKGTKLSVSIPAATEWLLNTYLPPRYPALFPPYND